MSKLDAATALHLFGTAEHPAAPRRLEHGPLRVDIVEGTVSSVFWDGVEVLCGIDYPVRDADWGTALPADRAEAQTATARGFSYGSSFTAGDFRGEFRCEVEREGELRLSVRLTAQRPTSVSRAGFVVLHPLEVAGAPLRVTHPDGTMDHASFPRLISPAQPAMNIRELEWTTKGITVAMTFDGDVFEMEDQRNWSDASYKTFCRPLLQPYPFDVAAGAVIEQSITLRCSGRRTGTASAGAGGATRLRVAAADGSRVAAFGLALDPAWPLDGPLGPAEAVPASVPRWLVRVDAASPADRAWLAATGGLLRRSPFDLEVIADGEPARLGAQLQELAGALAEQGLVPEQVLVLPRAYLRCIQTWEPSPPGARPADAVQAARQQFPLSRIGAGMLTNFTELNRCPPAGAFDYVTHALTPLVHAADDRSVMRALETLQPIFDTLHERAQGRPWRLGLATIGMRTNPYGRDVADKPGRVRLAMAQDDPRQDGLFAAAWMIGVAEAVAGRPVEYVALGAPYGPFGLVAAGSRGAVRPVYHAFAALAGLSGRPQRRLHLPEGVRGIAADTDDGVRAVIANCTAAPVDLDPGPRALVAVLDASSFAAAAVDRDWWRHARRAAGPMRLGAYGVAIVERPDEAGA
jgi:hypothetical protein